LSDTLPDPLELTKSTRGILNNYLEMTRSQLDAAHNNRKHYVKVARSYGMTFRDIGERLGYSEARIRQIAAE
jgi:DNA-directed RNA polymerase sigma subunit (sigma70/sigma32)